MSRREDIDNAIWGDPDFGALSAHAKLLYLWSFTNPYCGMAGVYKVTQKRMAWELAIDDDAGASALNELLTERLVEYEDGVLWVRGRVKHLRSRSPQMARSIAKDIEKLPEAHPIRVRFLETYATQSWLRDQLAILVDEVPSAYINPKVRAAVLERDGHACVDCGATDRLSMDHVTPRSHGGKATKENLQARCRSCNSRKGVKPNPQRETLEGMDPIHPTEPPEVPGPGKGEGIGQGHSGKAKAKAKEFELATSEPPANFPDELRPHLTEVHTVLSSLAERHGAKAVSMLSLGTMMAAPTRRHKPFVSAAYDFASWADGKAQRRKDVIAGYRDWLGKKDDLAGVERVTPKDDGNVVQLKSRFNIYDEAAGL